jgi:hypothetical protein
MNEIYELLKRYPDCKVSLTLNSDKSTFHIRVISKETCSTPGLDTDETRTEFQACLMSTISIVIPQAKIEERKINLVTAEIEWALEELQSIRES